MNLSRFRKMKKKRKLGMLILILFIVNSTIWMSQIVADWAFQESNTIQKLSRVSLWTSQILFEETKITSPSQNRNSQSFIKECKFNFKTKSIIINIYCMHQNQRIDRSPSKPKISLKLLAQTAEKKISENTSRNYAEASCSRLTNPKQVDEIQSYPNRDNFNSTYSS